MILYASSTDGWKSLTKDSVSGVCAIMDNKSYTLELIETKALSKDGPGMCEQFAQMIDGAERKYMCIVIFFTTDSDGSAKKGCKLLGKLRPYLLLPSCWAHQVSRALAIMMIHTDIR